MSIYTVSPDLLANIDHDEKIYLTDILYVFTQRGSNFKVAKDKKGHILDVYRSIENNADHIKHWLELMSYKPAKFENIDVDLQAISCIETMFIELCHNTVNDKQIIVYSKQNFKQHKCENSIIEYKDKIISVLDRDEANKALHPSETNYNISYSQVATNGSIIKDSTNL